MVLEGKRRRVGSGVISTPSCTIGGYNNRNNAYALGGSTMLIQQGRVWAADINAALAQIRAKHGVGTIYIREVGRRDGLVWYEFSIDKPGD